MVMGMKPGQVSPPIQLKDGYRILKLVTRESPGQRGITDPQVQQTIRDTLRNRKEQLLRSAYLAIARDEATVTNYLAEQVVETAGKLPEAAKSQRPHLGRVLAQASAFTANTQYFVLSFWLLVKKQKLRLDAEFGDPVVSS